MQELITVGTISRRTGIPIYTVQYLLDTQVEQMCNELVAERLAIPYEVDGEHYLHIPNNKKFLRKDIKRDIRFPDIPQAVKNKWFTESVTDSVRMCNENGSSDSTTDATTQEIKYNTATNKFENIPPEQIADWEKAYPRVNIPAEILKAEQWLKANPKKRKKDYPRFLVNWFSNTERNKGGRIENFGQQQSNRTDAFIENNL